MVLLAGLRKAGGSVGEDTFEDVHAEADEPGSEEEEDSLPLQQLCHLY